MKSTCRGEGLRGGCYRVARHSPARPTGETEGRLDVYQSVIEPSCFPEHLHPS